ncbi:hypothetical protein [Streptomyces sp. BBFR109]|uniref:hypothetical protein n=1 Tax=Streptomyces sp. BBFR109 TaxID=3448172 RepID=UPI003F761358
MAKRVSFTSHIKQWSAKKAEQIDAALLARVTAIHRDAGNLAPVLTRALVNSGRIRKNGQGSYSVIFGGGSVKYAKRRHYQNRKNPQTLLYLQRAGDANAREFKNDLRRIA